ncbi:MAG: TonB-dependent receptor [Candidatus Sphingomonas colombiensis]|nr:TonB-dependent receptor [Sphingomonas sp.]WEK42001.1 MAG: TonB-dependent receptor [Sphingomonas sp.]
MCNSKNIPKFLGTTSVVILMMCSHAQAQTSAAPAAAANPSDDSTEIVVTATRKEETLSKVPLSIAAYSQAALDSQGVKSIEDISRLTPGLRFAKSGFGNTTQIAIRGIQASGGAATTAIYLNDTPIQVRGLGFSSFNPFPQVFDLDRVEVLRGPQGTLFGAGSQGGAVRFILPKPSLTDYSGFGKAEVAATEHGAPSYEIGGAVGGPIVNDVLGFRFSAQYRHDGGWVDRVSSFNQSVVQKNANSADAYVVRGAVTFAPSSAVTITPSIFYQNVDTNDSGNFWSRFSNPAIVSNPSKGIFLNGNPIAESSHDEFYIPALDVEVDAGPVKITSNTSYLDRKTQANFDYTSFHQLIITRPRNPYPIYPNQVGLGDMHNTQRVFTQEVRLQSTDNDARFSWVVGAFYTKAKQTNNQLNTDNRWNDIVASTFGPAAVAGPFGALNGNIVLLNNSRSTDEQIAGFANVNYKITDQLTFTTGVRVSSTKHVFDNVQAGPGADSVPRASGSIKESPVTPKFGLNFQATDNLLFYTSAAKGFRIGGINPGLPTSGGNSCAADLASLGLKSSPASYKSDTVWSYELGAKGKALNGAVSFDASVYQINWDNIQQRVLLATCGLGYIANQGKARSRGFDMSLNVKPTNGLTLGFTLGYTDAAFTETLLATNGVPMVVAGDGIGNQPAFAAPPWQGTASAEYRFPIGSNRGYIRADYQYASKGRLTTFLDPRIPGSDPAWGVTPETHMVNARVGMKINEAVDASLFVNNLLGEQDILINRRDNIASTLFQQQSQRPRTIGLSLTYRP